MTHKHRQSGRSGGHSPRKLNAPTTAECFANKKKRGILTCDINRDMITEYLVQGRQPRFDEEDASALHPADVRADVPLDADADLMTECHTSRSHIFEPEFHYPPLYIEEDFIDIELSRWLLRRQNQKELLHI